MEDEKGTAGHQSLRVSSQWKTKDSILQNSAYVIIDEDKDPLDTDVGKIREVSCLDIYFVFLTFYFVCVYCGLLD